MATTVSTTDTLQDTFAWFQKAFPQVVSKNVHTQIGCHFEEVVEMLEELTSSDPKTEELLTDAMGTLHALAEHLKESDNVLEVVHHTRLLDSLTDQVVTATGTAYMLKYQFVPAVRETNASNYSKFVNGQPIYKANKKLDKGPGYFEPDLTKYVL